jgi:hypothetical protein
VAAEQAGLYCIVFLRPGECTFCERSKLPGFNFLLTPCVVLPQDCQVTVSFIVCSSKVRYSTIMVKKTATNSSGQFFGVTMY